MQKEQGEQMKMGKVLAGVGGRASVGGSGGGRGPEAGGRRVGAASGPAEEGCMRMACGLAGPVGRKVHGESAPKTVPHTPGTARNASKSRLRSRKGKWKRAVLVEAREQTET